MASRRVSVWAERVHGRQEALGVWFFRVLMNAVGQGLIFNIPAKVIAYNLAAGLLQTAAAGVLFGLTLRAPRVLAAGE